MKGFRYLAGVTTLEFDHGRCIGCGRCIEVCPHGVFVAEQGRVAVADRDACIECGACRLNCPTGAIAVDAGVGCATGLMNRWLREKGLRLRPPEGCS